MTDQVTVDRTQVPHERFELVWERDPTDYALAGAASRRSGGPPPEPVCLEVGRRLLLMQHTFSSWVLRRVEKLAFDEGRRVIRRTSIEFRVPEHAPVMSLEDGDYFLVPLSLLRRRTLVNLDLTDEEGRTVRMLGLRFTQALDEACLRAAARAASMDELGSEEVHPWLPAQLHAAIAGSRGEVGSARRRLELGRAILTGDLGRALRRPVLDRSLERLWHNFTLYALLPVDGGRNRMVQMRVDEPTEWKTQRPFVDPSDDDVTYYEPFLENEHISVATLLGFRPVRLRFLTPGAEHCASYHFEFTVPADVRIERASLLAGRPQRASALTVGAGVTLDNMTPEGPTAGLHAVEVPSGSLCRAQVDLRVRTQGWLGTLLASSVVCLAVLLTVVVHLHAGYGDGNWLTDQITNIVLLLVTVSAGSATYVAQSPAHVLAATMFRGLRVAGAALTALPAASAVVLVYLGENEAKGLTWNIWGFFLVGICGMAVALFAVIVTAYIRSWKSQKAEHAARSAWDNSDSRVRLEPDPFKGLTYVKAAKKLSFDGPAVGFHTSESWIGRYDWTDDKQRAVEASLASPVHDGTTCTCTPPARIIKQPGPPPGS